jgi:exoribonuclease R
MQYYKDYLDYHNIIDKKEGILINIDNIYYVNNEEVINNRCIMNDEVYIFNGEIIGIKKRNMKNIIGILYLDSKIKYGSRKDKILYLFKPTNKCYYHFYVPYKSSDFKNNKIYVMIQFKEWNTTDKLPIGTLIEVIGNVGDKNVEIEHLRNYYDIRNNTWKMDKKKLEEDLKILENLQNIIPDYEVFSIDPFGSKDIDDAFHFNKMEEDLYEIGIHIALPYLFFETELENIMNRVSTVYLPDKKYNMLPNIYADNMASLLENKNRYSLSLILKTNKKEIISYHIDKKIIKNIKNYDYDNFDKIYKKNINLKEFVEYSKIFFQLQSLNSFDSHQLVENWMIIANKLTAAHLIENNISNLILRVHNASLCPSINENINNSSLIDYLKIRNESSALYQLYKKEEEQKHSKLGNEYYTHFTSPIRRSVDLFIHALLLKKNNIMENEKLNKILDKINIFTKNTRKFDRNIKRLNFIYSIKELNKNIDTYAYIINITINKLTVYIPEYNLEEKIIIIPKKFEKIANIDLIKNESDNHIIKISYRLDDNDKILEYNLYQKIEIRLWVFTSFDNIFDKLKIEIL